MLSINKFFLILLIISKPLYAADLSISEEFNGLKNFVSGKKGSSFSSIYPLMESMVIESDINSYQKEDLASEIDSSLIQEWEDSWRKKDISAFSKLLSKDFKLAVWDQGQVSKYSTEYFKVNQWKPFGTSSELTFLRKYFSNFKKIEDVELQLVFFEPEQNSKKDEYSRALTKVRFDIRAQSSNGSVVNDRGIFNAIFEKTNGVWRLKQFVLDNGESVWAKEKFFSDSTKYAGLDQIPSRTRNEAIRRGGYALALADYNGDGLVDMLIGSEKETSLYKGVSGGKFVLDKEATSQLSEEEGVKTAVFADLSNGGSQDLILTKFNYSKDVPFISVYRNKKGKFVKVDFKNKRNPLYWPMPAAVSDFNNDGFLDLYVGFPGARDFTHSKTKEETNGLQTWMPHGLFLNNGRADLLEANKEAFNGSMDFNLHTYPHSAIAIDLNNDNLQDLIVMDDRGGLSPVFMNLGKGKFKELAGQIGLSNKGYGMGTAVADFSGDGLPDVVLTNVDFISSIRMGQLNSNPDINTLAKGLLYFKNKGDGSFEEVSAKAKLDWAGLGAAGAEAIDYDNDGWPDLYVANGLWSGTSRHEDLSSYFTRGMAIHFHNDRPMLDYTRSIYMKILTDYNGTLNKEGKGKLSMAGYQHNRLFHNNRDGTFTEIGYVAGVDTIADGYVIAKADLRKSGKLDLILRNADPGTNEYMFPTVQVLSNNTPVTNKSLQLRLEGVKSNRDGIGVKVTASIGERKIVQELVCNNGAAQSDKVVHIGMGQNKVIDALEVRWPSGKKNLLKNVQPGYLTIKEDTALGTL